MLAYVDFTHPFILEVFASYVGLGAVLAVYRGREEVLAMYCTKHYIIKGDLTLMRLWQLILPS